MATHTTLVAVLAPGALATAAATGFASPGDPRPHRGLPQGGEPVTLDPADFSLRIDNPYWPMRPGDRWVFTETDTTGAREKVVVEVTDRTRRSPTASWPASSATRRPRTARRSRSPTTGTPRTARATSGTAARTCATSRTAGSSTGPARSRRATTARRQGSRCPPTPVAGLAYRQEYAKGEAEDKGAIVTVGRERVQVPYGAFGKDVLMTRDLDALAPKVQELKLYVKGVGPVLSVHTDGAGGRAVLVKKPRRKEARLILRS